MSGGCALSAACNERHGRRGWGLWVVLILSFIWLMPHALAAKTPKAPANADCLACHTAEAGLTKEVNGKQVSLAVDEKKFNASIHGQMFKCVDCHKDVKTSPHENTPAKVSCADCHADAQKAFDGSMHAVVASTGKMNGRTPTCTSCHGGAHEILPPGDENSKVNHKNIPATCATCHSQKFVMDEAGLSSTTVASYNASVHGKAVAGGNVNAAVCTDCHSSHAILGPGNPKSAIYKFNVPATCAKCHDNVKTEFVQSIHGQALARGNWQAPVCTDCHGIHSIKKHTDPTSSVAAANLAKVTCSSCHEGVRMSAEFGVESRRATTYLQSYHGLASKLGSTVVANCASCHGVHNILPSSDPKSMVNKANLVKTCGKCHPGANQKFITGTVHIDVPLSADMGSTAIRWVRRFYIPLILMTIGGMLLHNFLIWRKKAIAIRNKQHRPIVRLTLDQRIQHALLLSSFITLVITGFALAYPDSWLGLVVGESFRRWAHRIAAVIMMAVGVYHAYYLAAKGEGRKAFLDMLPVFKDAADIRDNMRYYLGLGGGKPAFARFTYAEKMEYWALAWGWLIMSATGLMAWFKVGVGVFLPRWSVDVALAVHFYEAVLASLAIVVWHFYQVIVDPDVYPLNWAFWDGKMSEELYHEEHSLDALRMMQEQNGGPAGPREGEEVTAKK
ncbi:MAG: cytochrome b/b6 domain-containing protein [Acidobacteriia bacterium]|nr:cytochrome b/b6 domain-containing protein [Terriglobia bacterium]